MVFRDLTHQLSAEDPTQPLDRALRALHPGSSWNAVRDLIRSGKVAVNGEVVMEPARNVTGGSVIRIVMTAPGRARLARPLRDAIVHLDASVVVVKKPAGLATVPYEEMESETLLALLTRELRQRERTARCRAPLGVVHRLDKETSGLMVFARNLASKRHLEQQFRRHTIVRRYVALAHGHLSAGTLSSRLVANRGDGLRGSTSNPKLGRPAITHVQLIERLEGVSHVECRLETGRTHQIRIHLSEAGHPLLGERVYIRDYSGPILPAPRLMLHAVELGFVHPVSGEKIQFKAPMPDDMHSVLSDLRRA